MKPHVEKVTVTPDLALKWLNRHYDALGKGKYRQRNVSDGVVKRYAADMAAGDWLLSPQPIVFDEEDNLLDGQHRLEAVVKSKATIEALVSTGWPSISAPAMDGVRKQTTMDVIDRGKPRTVGQQLQLHGVSYANQYAACVQFMSRIANGGKSRGITFSACISILEQLDAKTHIDAISNLGQDSVRDFLGRFVGPLAYYHTAHPRKAESFARDVFESATARDTGPYLWLKWSKQNPRPQTEVRLIALSSCLRAWHENETMTRVVTSGTDAVKWLRDINPKFRDAIIKRTAD